MQTFLPYPSFIVSARVLDNKRLGKQRVECKQILKALRGEYDRPDQVGAWVNHPATKMWRGFEDALCVYGVSCCAVWRKRGYDDSLMQYFIAGCTGGMSLPPWLGNEEFHASHRSNLLRKDPEWYGQFGWAESKNLPYVWPTTGENP